MDEFFAENRASFRCQVSRRWLLEFKSEDSHPRNELSGALGILETFRLGPD